MTVEERLKKMREHYSDVFDTASSMIEQYEAIYYLATQLAGWVRKLVEGWQHDETCESLRDGSRCSCNGMVAAADRFLDGSGRGDGEMTAEERVKTQVEEVEKRGCFLGQEAAALYDLAREAIALLREASKYARHTCPGPMTRPCACGFGDYNARAVRFLDGKE